jgi:uncharacterized repeat protein (TIGR02543 family)
MANESISSGTPTALTTNSFTRTGYGFAGWNTAANGSGTAYANGATVTLTGDLALYAQWSVHYQGLRVNGVARDFRLVYLRIFAQGITWQTRVRSIVKGVVVVAQRSSKGFVRVLLRMRVPSSWRSFGVYIVSPHTVRFLVRILLNHPR